MINSNHVYSPIVSKLRTLVHYALAEST